MNEIIAGMPLWSGIRTASEAFKHPLSPATKQRRWDNIRSFIGSHGEGDTIELRCSLANISKDELSRVLEHAPTVGNSLDFLPRHLLLRYTPPNEMPAIFREVPFAGVMAATVASAVRSLQETLTKQERAMMTHFFTEDLSHGLLEELCMVSNHALLLRFNDFIASSKHAAGARLAKLSSKVDSEAYEDFLTTVAADGGLSFFSNNPVILRLLRIRLEYWVKNSTYLIKALYRDRNLIVKELGISPFQRLERLWPNKSDSHHGGKSVSILQTDCGDKIVFKPRSLRLEIGFMRILDHLNKSAGSELFRIIRILDCKNHGWCEFIEHSESPCREDIEMFYYRTGLLTSVLHAFRATDCHFENMIASRNYPVMVDLETLFHPDPVISAKYSAVRTDCEAILSSVTRIGILPDSHGLNEEGDLTALGAGLTAQSFVRRRFVHIGSSLMDLQDTTVTLSAPPSRPACEILPRAVLVDRIKSGFADGYDLLLRERETVLTSSNFLPSLKTARCRYVARPTRAYAWLLQRSIDGSLTESGVDSSLEFERLYRMCLDNQYQRQWYSIAEAERNALEHLDIPHFSVHLSKRALYSGAQRIVDSWLPCSPLTAVKKRIQELSNADCQHQLRIIELSFALQSSTEKPARQLRIGSRHPATPKYTIVDVARDIAHQIRATAYRTREGAQDWATVGFSPQPGRYRIESCGRGLYRGRAGIALFFAALFSIDRDPQHSEYARSILKDCYLRHATDRFDVAEGVSGTAYALYSAGRLMNDLDLRQRAHRLMSSIDVEKVTSSKSIDFMGGGAGILLVAELIGREFWTYELDRLIRDIADELLRREIPLGRGISAWKTIDEQYLPGFAHGSSGIAYALARAGVRLTETRYLRAAHRGLNNQEYLFDQALGNWRDLRIASRGEPLSLSWCHGATGIGLAAIATESLFGRAAGDTIARCLRIVSKELSDEAQSLDCLCCGRPSALELLLSCRESTRPGQLLSRLIVDICEHQGYNYLPGHASAPFLPGLFLGAAGVGYQLLRSTFPQRIPNVLLLE